MSDSDSDDDCGIIRPSLIKQLRSILDQYPDDGQILKELIQNAEDAGASEVTFLYDQHSHGTQNLHHESLEIHQGPGLIAYNDASFTKKDWTGIRSLYESIKEEDPLKVGRFGLGFKSVFHLTDLPSILSGQKLLILDPHENILNKKGKPDSGYMWNLERDKTCLTKTGDQFAPYLGLFECSIKSLKGGDFRGTLFRFPLRKERSKLSQTIYNGRKMRTLFESFEADAHLVLLFLKRVERIILSERGVDDRAPKIKFEVRIAETCRETVRKERADFRQKVESLQQSGHQQNHISSSYRLSIEILQNDAVKNTHHYLIRECYAAGEVSATFQNLRQELQKSYVPLVGVAMQLTEGDAKTRSENPEGQTFCVLPLPREQRSSSGLPVHINGYFSVDQNRRHLKWGTTRQTGESDKDVAWNTCLLTEVLPACYVDLIKTAIECQKEHRGVSIADIYAAIPSLQSVDEKLQPFVQKMLSLVLQEQWLFTSANRGQWVSLPVSVLDEPVMDEKAKIVRQVLLSMGYNIVIPPTHVLTVINKYSHPGHVAKVRPHLLRTALQRNNNYTRLDDRSKITLLEVILQDMKQGGQELFGITLLPLADGTFTTFRDQHGSPIYVPSSTQQEILQRLEKQLLRINQIPTHLLARLREVAALGGTCLKEISPSDMPRLIEAVLPKEWQSRTEVVHQGRDGPNAKWFEKLWAYLQLVNPVTSLTAFEGLMILPLTTCMPMQLITLKRVPNVLFKQYAGTKLSVQLQNFFRKLGVFIADGVPEYVRQHPGVLDTYIKPPSAKNVLAALLYASEQFGVRKVVSLVASDGRIGDDLVSVVDRGLASYTPSFQETGLLKQLPIFPTTKSTPSKRDYASVCEVTHSTSGDQMLLSLPYRLLLVQSEKMQTVSAFLGAELLSSLSILRKYIIPGIDRKAIQPSKIEDIMRCVCEGLPSVARKDNTIYDDFSRLSFVKTKSGQLSEPRNLFHPGSALCKSLFSGMNNMFPCGIYAEPEMLAILLKMKLKREQDLGIGDLEQAVLSLRSIPPLSGVALSIAASIRKVVNTNPTFLAGRTPGSTSLLKVLKSTPWVLAVQDRPSQYPKSLKWLGTSTSLCKPSDIVSSKWQNIVGSVNAVVDRLAPEVEQAFAWQHPPSLPMVVKHLKNVIESYCPEEKAAYLNVILNVYRYFETCNLNELRTSLRDCPRWLWVGDQFVLPEIVVLNKTFLDLHPFVCTLPQELNFFKLILPHLGVRPSLDSSMLINVLHSIKCKNEEDEDTFEQNGVHLEMVVSILNHIKKDFAGMSESLKGRVLVPVDCEPNMTFELQPVEDCTYCDTEWLKQDLELGHFDSAEKTIKIVHRNLPLETVRELGVTPLMNHVLPSQQLEFTAFGQSESLANRIRHLLEDYTDGLAVFKEMIQNADDAGATKVKFLYDARTNDDARLRLLYPNLKDCQGAALWVHNDAVFEDEDFQNIISLGCSNKEKAVDKIGKFGLGFNVVYNLTDVPSFVTRDSLVIFDPQMSHLCTVHQDKSNPGIKLNNQQIRPFLKSCDQFLPYEGVYGCNLSQPYQGTLFRFPLRTAEQADTSNLCRKQYSRTDMVELLKMLEHNAHSLLLFTQNVEQIELDFLPDGQKPDQLVTVFTVQKRKLKMIKKLPFPKGDAELPHGSFGVLHTVAKNAEAFGDQNRQSVLIETRKTVEQDIQNLEYKRTGGTRPEYLSWIISTVIQHPPGSNSENQIFQMGGVALQLEAVGCDFLPLPLKNAKHRGQVFCGLPLPVYCDLPVHINGNFALHSSRRGFPTGTGDDKHNEKLEWNKGLMRDVLPEAYLFALEDAVTVLANDARVPFHDLWPSSRLCKEVDHVDITPLIDSFFSRLLVTATSPLQHDENGLVTIDAAVFLDRELAPNKEIKTTVLESFVQVCPDWKPVILPRSVFGQLRDSDQGTLAKKRWYDFERYFREIVFPNVRSLKDNLEKLLLFALDHHELYDSMVRKLNAPECIGVLSSLKNAYGDEALKPTLLGLACDMLRCLVIAIQKEQVLPEDIGQKVFLPNGMNVLMPLDKLYYTDVRGFERNPLVVSKKVLSPTVRALGVKSWHEYLYERSSIGLPFGQSEDLANAIKRVLGTYPRDLEILKELVQNADDAKATQIHFILDNRHHPSQRVFHNSWKPLQGPALCVFTDSPFTEEDLVGIQAFGIGAKRNDPSKTGQYGIGFNSVYHITDAPSLLTSESGKQSLCVFDPQRRFVPCASREKPGRKFVDLENLKKEFPDVFRGYLENCFNIENATMMRLPLRSPLMAKDSTISHESSPDVRELFRLLEKEGKDLLIFLNSLKEIEVSEIDAYTGEMRSIYKITAQLCPQSKKERITPMSERIAEAMKTMDRDAWKINSIPLSTSVKCLQIADTEGYKEKWLVAESLGTDLETIPQPVEDAIHNEQLRLLPRGGVAAPLSHAIPFEGKAFCSLPLPRITKLPVHVNGHFALGHENRRHLWNNSDTDGYKKGWNDFLCENVISVAYTELLVALKKVVTESCSGRDLLKRQLSHHQSYFPVYTDERDTWHGLVKACYQRLASVNVDIIPVLIEKPTASKQQQQNTRGTRAALFEPAVVSWKSLQARGKLKVFFSEAVTTIAEEFLVSRRVTEWQDWQARKLREKDVRDEQDVLKKCLIRCGFLLVEMQEELASSFETCDVPITRISPGEVLTGFSSRQLEALPENIVKTPLRDEETLITLLQYCSKDEKFVELLDGLPLLLTADNQLRKFDQTNPAYFTSDWVQRLFPNSAGMFVKEGVFSRVFFSKQKSQLAVMKHFGIEEMSLILQKQLPRPTLCTYSAVKFDKSLEYLKNGNWLNLFWMFIEEELKDLLVKPVVKPPRKLSRADLEHWFEQRNREEKLWLAECKGKVKQRLKCVEDWCLIPTTKRDIKYLVALKHSNMVLGHSYSESERYQVFELLRRCGVHELSIVNPYDKQVLEIPSLLVTTTDNARACLHLLHSALNDQTGAPRLDREDARTLLSFFSDNTEMFQQDVLATSKELVELPLHKTIYGKLKRLSGYNVVILPENIPTEGIEDSEKRTRTLFIEFNKTLKRLYTFLETDLYTSKRFYCEFIFPQFQMFRSFERVKHLYFLFGQCVSAYRLDEESEGLLEKMKTTAIITDRDGYLKHASDFYDQTNQIFKAFKSEMAPPAAELPFRYHQWEQFLVALGLVRQVSPKVFIECAQQVAIQGKKWSPSDETAEKSKILMQFIFDETSLNDNNLRVISTIGFVEPSSIPEKLRRLCPLQMASPGYIKLSGSVPKKYAEVVWTQIRLLPDWADPEMQHLQRTEIDHLTAVLGIQKRPSVNLVLKHLCTLAGHLSSTTMEREQSQLTMKVFKNIYKHLGEYSEEKDDTSLNEMQNTECILVEQGTHLVTPSQIVRDLPEEIEPFLYRIPDEMMTFQELFMKLGATEKPTVTSFVMVLIKLYMASENGMSVMSPNQTRQAFLAVKGLFGVVTQREEFPECELYLPSVEGKLSLSSKLICNDVPSFFRRIRKLDGKQLVNLAECGIEPSVALGAVEKLPRQHQPRFVSNEIEEVLNEPDSCNEGSDVANRLNQRVKSEVFRQAVMQLLLHEDYSNNRQPNKEEVTELVNRLEMVKVHAVDRVHTVLRKKKNGQKLKDSSADKVCHFEKRRQRDFYEWSIFIKDCSALNEKLLIPFARVINQILDSKLQTSVLNLLPLLTCQENEIVEKLKEFDVDVGALEMTQREPLLPSPGKKLSSTHSKMTKHQTSNIRVKDYVATQLDDALVYAIVKNITNETDRTFLLDTGSLGMQRVTAERILTF